jgi:hypothetical protein
MFKIFPIELLFAAGIVSVEENVVHIRQVLGKVGQPTVTDGNVKVRNSSVLEYGGELSMERGLGHVVFACKAKAIPFTVKVDYIVRDSGIRIIAGSAGAHIATADVAHVAKYDKDTFCLTDFSGLGLYNGILICHYTEDRKADFDTLNSLGKYRVISLSDDQSIVIKDE